MCRNGVQTMPRRNGALETPDSARSVVRIAILALLALVAPILTSGPARAVTVTERHPRILIYADSLAALKARCLGQNSAIYNKWYQFYDTKRNWPNFIAYWIEDMAALYVISGETKFADTAIRETMRCVRAGGEFQDSFGRLNPIVLTYDWCHDRLSPAQSDSIVAYCLHQLDIMATPDEYFRTMDLRWQYAAAIWGEAGDRNDFVDAKLQSCIDVEEDRVLPCLDAISSGGVTGYYPGVFFSNHMYMIDCLRHATDYTGSILESSYWNNSPTYWIHRLRPDFTWMRMTGRLNNSEAYMWPFVAYFSNRMGNRFAQTVANLQSALFRSGGDNLLPVLLWYVPSMAAEPLENMPTTFVDQDYGYYIWRSGWNFGAASTDAQIAFYNGPDVEPDHERTQNSFTVTRGADDLLINAGHFYSSGDQHYVNYVARAVSRNTVLVYDPGESFGAGVPNDGGQCDSDLSRGRALWPECGAGIGYRGFATLIPPGPGVLFGVRGYAGKAYSAAKCRGVSREFLIPRANWIIIQDRVTVARPGLDVRIVFHSIERPTVDGHLEQIEGGAYGGIYRSTDTKVITIQRGNSVALIYPVYIGKGVRSEVRLVGGASPSNLVWRQNVKSSTALTYVADAAGQSYECWVDGSNRSPTHNVTQEQIDTRNIEPHACGDWRVEILVPAAETEVYAVTAIEIGPRGTPAKTLDWSESGGRVTIEGISDDYVPHLTPLTHAE